VWEVKVSLIPRDYTEFYVNGVSAVRVFIKNPFCCPFKLFKAFRSINFTNSKKKACGVFKAKSSFVRFEIFLINFPLHRLWVSFSVFFGFDEIIKVKSIPPILWVFFLLFLSFSSVHLWL
jgi:hypothetical protein